MQLLVLLFSVLFFQGIALGQVYVYPNRGQSPQQQERDKYEFTPGQRTKRASILQTHRPPRRPPRLSRKDRSLKAPRAARHWALSEGRSRAMRAEARQPAPPWAGSLAP